MSDPSRDRLFAATAEGIRLPVIDITDPAFAAPATPAEAEALAAAALQEEVRRGPLQRLAFRLILRRLARQSRLVAALQAANNGYLGGIATYVMKLGPDNLVPPYDTPIDRRIAQSPTVTSMRVRLQQVAELLAAGLAPRLAGNSHPLCLLEIAGGPSADALNALILLARNGHLASRPVQIVIYDLDAGGPRLAMNLLAALKTGPLAGATIGLRHVSGDWGDAPAIARLVAGFPADAIVAATSEGGLFEYGSDEDITAVLGTLRDRAATVTGSVTRDDALIRMMRRHSRPRTRPRGLERFAQLIAPTGYRIARSLPSPLSDQVLLSTS